MDKVYLVTKGRYSDYSVYGVFIDKYLAEEYARQISDGYDSGHVGEREIKTEADLLLPVGFSVYGGLMDIDGNTDRFPFELDNQHDVEPFPEIDYDTGEERVTERATGCMWIYILTDKGLEGAIKIANERRIQMIANNTWPIAGTILNKP